MSIAQLSLLVWWVLIFLRIRLNGENVLSGGGLSIRKIDASYYRHIAEIDHSLWISIRQISELLLWMKVPSVTEQFGCENFTGVAHSLRTVKVPLSIWRNQCGPLTKLYENSLETCWGGEGLVNVITSYSVF